MSVVKCALQIVHRKAAAISRKHGLPLRLRIGLHFGDVSFGDFGASNRIAVTLLGAAVNTLQPGTSRPSPPSSETSGSALTLRDLMIRSGVNPDTFRVPTKVEVKHGVELDVYSI